MIVEIGFGCIVVGGETGGVPERPPNPSAPFHPPRQGEGGSRCEQADGRCERQPNDGCEESVAVAEKPGSKEGMS